MDISTIKRVKAQTTKSEQDIAAPASSSPLLRIPGDVLLEVLSSWFASETERRSKAKWFIELQIFKWTHPVALLQLARTNKALRNDLMSNVRQPLST